MRFLFIFVKLTIEFRNIELFCTQFNSRVFSLIHIILMFFFMWSGNHKFYIPFSRLLRLQSLRITLYYTVSFFLRLAIGQTVEKVVKNIFLARRKRPKLEIVRCWLSRQWRYSGGRSTYYYFGALNSIFQTKVKVKKVVSCRPQAKIINRVVDEVCKCLRSARTLS
jgi:hypothetical protein